MKNSRYSRRDFIKGAACMVAASGVSSFVPKLNLMSEALAQTSVSGYKALVCVYLAGGNDSWNMLLPIGDNGSGQYSHPEYVTARNGLYTATNTGGLGIPRTLTAGALPAALALNGGNLGVNPFAPELASLFNSNRLAFIANIGTLVEPLTRAEYLNRSSPPGLYSHNDQTSLWQIGSGSSTMGQQGFGGMIAGVTALPNPNGLPPVISIAGQSRFLVGETLGGAPVFPFQLSSSATTPATILNNYSASAPTPGENARRAALEELLDLAYPQHFSTEHQNIFNRSLSLAELINTQVTGVDGVINTAFPNTSLGSQLRQVARMIKVSRINPGAIAANRQVYYVNAGGYDTHSAQITSTSLAQGHHLLLQQLSQAVAAFNTAMDEISAANEVTLFSMSDFARTLNANGSGTDHAWGGVQFVMGGAVNGGQVYGRYPRIALNMGADSNGESFSRGQFLPTTAVDQMGATLARWMGVDDVNLPTIFPNIDNFVTGPYANAGETPAFANFTRVIPDLFNGIA